jgi:pimeloyl-ACP methyl ester carboxylesterase
MVVDVWDAPESDVPPIVLIHGWGGSGSYWRGTAAALAKNATVIVPDLPGTGRSQPVKSTQNMYQQVQNLALLLDALELTQVQLVGHSMGSAMAILLTAQQPQRVERLVLTSMTFFMTQAQKNFYQRMMQGFHVMMRFRPAWLVDVPGMTHMMAQQYFYRVPNDPAILRQGLQDYLQLDRATALACADNATDDAILAAGKTIQAPVLLIAARQDNMMPKENVGYTLDILRDSRVCWIDQCGHLPMVEKPTQYLALLRDFLHLTP